MNKIHLGKDLETKENIYIDMFDTDNFNYNISIFGMKGSGIDNTALNLMDKSVRNFIIDDEGEYKNLLSDKKHKNVLIVGHSKINPFQLNKRYDIVNDIYYLNLKDKIYNITNLIMFINSSIWEPLSSNESSIFAAIINKVVSKLYRDKGITEDIDSLYINNKIKPMPTISDFCSELESCLEENLLFKDEIKLLLYRMLMFKKENIFGVFDCQTSLDIDMNDNLVVFDLSNLEESILKPIGTFITMSYIWDNFIDEKNSDNKTRLIYNGLDNIKSSDYYLSDLIVDIMKKSRVRRSGVTLISRNFPVKYSKISNIINYSEMIIFLRQDVENQMYLHKEFNLTSHQVDFLMKSNLNEALIKNREGIRFVELIKNS